MANVLRNPTLRTLSFACGVMGLAALAGCDPQSSSTEAAYQAALIEWEKACPEARGETSDIHDRAEAGDLEAIDCLIREYRTSIAALKAAEHTYRSLNDEDGPGNSWDVEQSHLMDYLYTRWRLSGEGWDELSELARTMSKTEIESAISYLNIDAALLPRREIDACGRVIDSDPRYAVIQLGSGDRDPPECGRTF